MVYSRREARIDLCDFLLQNTTEFYRSFSEKSGTKPCHFQRRPQYFTKLTSENFYYCAFFGDKMNNFCTPQNQALGPEKKGKYPQNTAKVMFEALPGPGKCHKTLSKKFTHFGKHVLHMFTKFQHGRSSFTAEDAHSL